MATRSTLRREAERREDFVPQSLSFWLTVVLLWAAYGLLSTNQSFLFYSLTTDTPIEWARLLGLSLGLAFVWALTTPAVIYIARRFPVHRHNWQSRTLLHLAFALACWLLLAVLTFELHGVLAPPRPASFLGYALLQLDVSVFLYFVMVALTHAFSFYRMYRERELRAATLENQLTTARLHVLAMQLQPHFLFNTLNAIAELVHQDADRADEMLAGLGQLLRRSIENSREQEVPLAKELDFLASYIDIERLRYGERLAVTLAADEDVRSALVPNFLLQPIVENAIQHSVARAVEPGRILVTARRRGAMLSLTVDDNGSGPSGAAREGVGMGNTRARLAQLYGRAHRLELARKMDGGALVTIEIPFRPAPAGRDAALAAPVAVPLVPSGV